jgi:hypothetical protein
MSAPAAELAGAPLLAWLDELLADALSSPRLSRWEEQFLRSIMARRRQFGERLQLRPKEMVHLREIEEKIHAAG